MALVVGNGGYDDKKNSRLDNPVNDAELMAKTLERVGFQVTLVTDADQAKMKASIKEFGKRLIRAGQDSVGLFFYAGHGAEAKGQNYLIPIGADIEIEMDYETDGVPASWMLSRMGAAPQPLEHGDSGCLPGQSASSNVSQREYGTRAHECAFGDTDCILGGTETESKRR